MKKNILLIGCGEVGNALKRIEEEAKNKVYILDLNNDPPDEIEYDVAHVCIPYSIDFVDIISVYMRMYMPELTIIHSTVKPGTTEKLEKEADMCVVHSPVRGVHPNLYKGIKTFVKYVGSDDDYATHYTKKHYKSLNLKFKFLKNSKTSEMLKIYSTTYYGWNILFAKLIKQICDEEQVDFDEVYTHANKTYNDGYKELNMNHVIRPVLYPPKGKILKHCVSQNFELLPNGKLKKICKDLNDK